MSLEDDAACFNPDAYALAQRRVTRAPLELTEADFAQLASVSPQLETDARDAQQSAQLALVNARTSAPLHTKAAPATPTTRTTLTQADVDLIAEGIGTELFPIFQNHKAKLATLEQRITEQDARILELEAALASRTVTQ